jgi:hypothetical protein
MTESWKSSLLDNGSVKRFRGNEHVRSNRTTVSMQQRGKDTYVTIEELLGKGFPAEMNTYPTI